jgi:hypothetical protein
MTSTPTDPIPKALLDTRGVYTAPWSECDPTVRGFLSDLGLKEDDEPLVVCARLPERFVVVTRKGVWWLQDRQQYHLLHEEIAWVVPTRYAVLGVPREDFERRESEVYPTGEAWEDRDLRLETRDGRIFTFFVEPGLALGGIWNLIDHLSQPRKAK